VGCTNSAAYPNRVDLQEVRISAPHALGHPTLGRPLVICNAFGFKVPEIAPEDLLATPIARLPPGVEDQIADEIEAADETRRAADVAEDRCVALVEEAFLDALGPAPHTV
jgi:hypothetical protein